MIVILEKADPEVFSDLRDWALPLQVGWDDWSIEIRVLCFGVNWFRKQARKE